MNYRDAMGNGTAWIRKGQMIHFTTETSQRLYIARLLHIDGSISQGNTLFVHAEYYNDPSLYCLIQVISSSTSVASSYRKKKVCKAISSSIQALYMTLTGVYSIFFPCPVSPIYVLFTLSLQGRQQNFIVDQPTR
jgi:hypothetical protein